MKLWYMRRGKMEFDVVIIGNSAAAIGCIEAIRSRDRELSIAVVSEEKYHTYSRALIPYYLAGKIDLEKIYYRPSDFYERMGVTPLLGERAVSIDFERKIVRLESGREVLYDKLLIATGGKPFIPPMEGFDRNLRNAFSFVTLDDALGIEEMLPETKKVVILGAGVIGLMAAEVLSEKGLEVHVIELVTRVLAPVVDEKTSQIVQNLFEDRGVKIHTGLTIRKINSKDGLVRSVVLTDGSELECDLLIVAVGVIPRTELVEGTAVKVNRGILVNRKMETSVRDVYAAGDCAEIYDFLIDDRRVIPLWPNAYLGGRIAAINMLGEEAEFEATSMNAMHFFDLYIINAGLNITDEIAEREGYEILMKYDPERMVYRRLAIKNGLIKGLIFVGRVERAGIYLNLMRKKIVIDEFKNRLLDYDFGYSKLPESIRWDLLKDEVILGVI
jgi:NAD(P)H-nitrite reductase large subunit